MALRFIMSMNSWMSKNEITEIDVEEFDSKYNPGEKTHLIRGLKETIFLAKKLKKIDKEGNITFDLDPDVLQIVEIDDSNLCLCNTVSGKVVGKIKKK